MAMATPSLTTTIFATRAGTRIFMRTGDDDGARSLRRRRRSGGVATAQRSATQGRRRGARGTARAPRRSLRRSSAGALGLPSSEMKMHLQEGRGGRHGRSATTGSGTSCASRATTFPMMPPRRNFG